MLTGQQQRRIVIGLATDSADANPRDLGATKCFATNGPPQMTNVQDLTVVSGTQR